MFYLIFAAIYALLHLYLYSGLVAGLGSHSWTAAAALGLLFASIFLGRTLESRGATRPALLVTRIGYTWFGLSGIFATLLLLADTAQLLVPLSNRAAFFGVVGSGIIAAAGGAIQARHPRLKRVALSSPKLALGQSQTLRIAQISDLHLGDGSTLAITRRIVDRLNALQPDIIVSTGDLFDGFLDLLGPHVAELRRLKAPLGKFAIVGNHEVYAGLSRALRLTEQAGFALLRNQTALPRPDLAIAGLDDPASPLPSCEAELLDEVDPEAFVLLLKHRPDLDTSSMGRFNLQLSGHTHGGQIFPFHLLVKLAHRAKPGLTRIAADQYLYLSRGTGSWGPQIRLFAPPEITLFTLSP